MPRAIGPALAFALVATGGWAAGAATASGPEATVERLSEAARRGDQAGVDALVDKARVALARQSRRDQLTGHGRWLKAPDATCAAWRPVSRRWPVDPDQPLSAVELALWLRSGPGEPTLWPRDDESVSVVIPFGVTAAELELAVLDGRWVVVGAFDPVEAPPPPRFDCVEPRGR